MRCVPWVKMAPTDRTSAPAWLSVCQHRIRGLKVPCLLVLQHPIIPSQTRIVAPVVPASGARATLLAPRELVGDAR